MAEHDIQVKATGDAGKEKRGRAEALALARSAERVIAARAGKMVTFDMKKDRPDDATLLKHLLGPTGNLRAPTFRRGKTLVVGFTPEAYADALGT